MGFEDLAIHFQDLPLHMSKLAGEWQQTLPRQIRDAIILFVSQRVEDRVNAHPPPGSDDPELS